MIFVVSNVAAIAIVLLYYSWRNFCRTALDEQNDALRQRVAYMLWVMADDDNPSDTREIRVVGRTG